MKSEKRFLFHADFLGTTEGYSDIELIRIQRGVLEQVVQAQILRNVDEHDLHVYIASDSLYICCPCLDHLLQYAARLFSFYFSIMPGQPRLRGAISYGEKAVSSVITNTKRVVAIPLLDESLPRVHKLEKLRKGSRILLDQNIPAASCYQHESYLLHWKSITGKGDKQNTNVREFLWPRLACNEPQDLLRNANLIKTEWLQQLGEKEWGVEQYEQGIMIQLDETLKLFIRSLAPFNDDHEVKSYLLSLLPETSDHKGSVVFEWGVWFQALKALCEPNGELSDHLKHQIKVMKQALVNARHLHNFQAELEELDYADFKKCVSPLLH